MNVNLLKLAEKKETLCERFFHSKDSDVVLYVSINDEKHGKKIYWDLLMPIHADIPFGGWIIVKSNLSKTEVKSWASDNL